MSAHLGHEFVEEVGRVVRARSGLGMVLDRKDRQAFVSHSFQTAVVQVEMRQLNLVVVQTVGIDREAMVMRGNLYSAAAYVFDGLIASAMAEFEFECLSTE